MPGEMKKGCLQLFFLRFRVSSQVHCEDTGVESMSCHVIRTQQPTILQYTSFECIPQLPPLKGITTDSEKGILDSRFPHLPHPRFTFHHLSFLRGTREEGISNFQAQENFMERNSEASSNARLPPFASRYERIFNFLGYLWDIPHPFPTSDSSFSARTLR